VLGVSGRRASYVGVGSEVYGSVDDDKDDATGSPVLLLGDVPLGDDGMLLSEGVTVQSHVGVLLLFVYTVSVTVLMMHVVFGYSMELEAAAVRGNSLKLALKLLVVFVGIGLVELENGADAVLVIFAAVVVLPAIELEFVGADGIE
jgi:hypothetical protein